MFQRLHPVPAAIAALTFFGAAAPAQHLRVVEPRVGHAEFAGAHTRVALALPPGLGAANGLVPGEALVVRFDLVNAGGLDLFTGLAVNVFAGDTSYSATNGATFVVDLATAGGLPTLLNSGSVAGVRFRVKTTSAAQFNVAPFHGANEAADEVLAKDIVHPKLLIAVAQPGGAVVDFVFSEPLATDSAINGLNQTSLSLLSAADVQRRIGGSFQAFAPALSNARWRDPARRILRMDAAQPILAIPPGQTLRPALDGAGAPAHDFYDIVRNRAAADAAPFFARGSCQQHDLTGDGFIGSDDLAILLVYWGKVDLGTRADFDLNGLVDSRELAELLGGWGLCE